MITNTTPAVSVLLTLYWITHSNSTWFHSLFLLILEGAAHSPHHTTPSPYPSSSPTNGLCINSSPTLPQGEEAAEHFSATFSRRQKTPWSTIWQRRTRKDTHTSQPELQTPRDLLPQRKTVWQCTILTSTFWNIQTSLPIIRTNNDKIHKQIFLSTY